MDFQNMDLTAIKQAEYLFKLGNSQLASGHLEEASESFQQASILFLKEKKYPEYLRSQLAQIMNYKEMENFEEINRIQKELLNIMHSPKAGATSAMFYYALGLGHLSQKDFKQAHRDFNQGLSRALQCQKTARRDHQNFELLCTKTELCFISYGLVQLFYESQHDLSFVSQELSTMELLLKECRNLRDSCHARDGLSLSEKKPRMASLQTIENDLEKLELAYQIMQANKLRREKKYNLAENSYWACYEKSQKILSRRYMSSDLFYTMGLNYMDKEDYEHASIFLNLAQKSVRAGIFKALHRKIQTALDKLKNHIHKYDIVVNLHDKSIVEKNKGSVNFKNQFILLDLLKTLVSNPGIVYSKEKLMQEIWNQKYDPLVHNNKIYVTIKRLRALVEPNYSDPRYIFRTKQGYYFSNKVKVLLK